MTKCDGRSPRGERGLKFLRCAVVPLRRWSLPSRGAWIEMEIRLHLFYKLSSLPSRGAWIEMRDLLNANITDVVAPLAGSVD